MKIARVLGAATMTCGLLLFTTPSFAHHSFSAEFDGRNCREFTGTLTKIDWQSPHPYFYMDIKDAAGKVQSGLFLRNTEGKLLPVALAGQGLPVVYVDSDSTDGSVELARSMGA